MSFYIIVFWTLLSAAFGYFRYKFSYWDFQGVKQPKTHFLWGNFFKLKTVRMVELLHEVYAEFKGKALIGGTYIYTRPVAVALDLDLIKAILIKDFNKFVNRSVYRNEKNDPLAAHLFALDGERWRSLRTKLTPTFTSGKMKFMFPTIVDVAGEFRQAVEDNLKATDDGIIELYDLNARYTTDVIGKCVFGIECNSLKDPNVEFRRMGRLVFGSDNFSVRWRIFKATYANYLTTMRATIFS